MKVLFVGDHVLLSEGVTELLRSEETFSVHCADTVDDALRQSHRWHPDVVLVQSRLQDGSAIQAIRVFKDRALNVPVVILSSDDDDDVFLSALAEGARGFLGRTTDRARLVRSLIDVAEGRLAISERLAERLAAEYVAKADGRRTSGRSQPGYVTERELEILQLLSRGMTNGAIAQSLYLSENTVRAHIRNIVLKLNAENRVQAVARAMNLGLLQPQPNGSAGSKATQLPA